MDRFHSQNLPEFWANRETINSINFKTSIIISPDVDRCTEAIKNPRNCNSVLT